MVQIDFFGNATEECEAPNTKWPTVDASQVVSGRWVLRNSLLLGSNYLIEHLSLEPWDLMHWSQILPLVIYQAGCVVFARANLTYRGFYQQVQLQSSTGEKCKYKLRGRKRWNWRRRNGDTNRSTHRVNIEQSASGRCEADICNWTSTENC